jgi:hypothetical protein
MSDDGAVADSNDGQRRNDILVGSQVIHQPSLARVGTAAERSTVNCPHGRLIRGTFSTQQHRRILSPSRADQSSRCPQIRVVDQPSREVAASAGVREIDDLQVEWELVAVRGRRG